MANKNTLHGASSPLHCQLYTVCLRPPAARDLALVSSIARNVRILPRPLPFRLGKRSIGHMRGAYLGCESAFTKRTARRRKFCLSSGGRSATSDRSTDERTLDTKRDRSTDERTLDTKRANRSLGELPRCTSFHSFRDSVLTQVVACFSAFFVSTL